MSVRLDVPFISQLIGGQGGNNCGPACLAMALAYRGVISPDQESMLECADIARDGLSDDVGETGGYTTLNQLQMVAGWYGQACWWPVSWEQVDASLDRQEPVIILLNNRVLLPRQYPATPAFNATHFVLLTGYDEPARGRPSSDPLSVTPGGPSVYTEDTVRRGVHDVGGVHALALVPLDIPAEPEEIAMLEDWQVKGWILAPLYQDAGIPYNPESGTAQAWVDRLRDGHYVGRPRSGERPYGEGDEAGVWVEWERGALLYRLRDGQTSWEG